MLKVLFYSTCIFLSATLSASSAIASDYFSNALRIYSEGKYFEASIEFERAIFYDRDSNMIARSQYYKSLCYRGLEEYRKALNELKAIDMRKVPDSLSLLIYYEKAFCSYQNNDPVQALGFFDEVTKMDTDTLLTFDFIPLHILCLNACRNYDKATKLWDYYLKKCGVNDSTKYVFRVEQKKLYENRNIPKIYSPLKAQRLSSLVPGTGQIYSGAIGEGTFNLIINISLLSFTVWEISSKYYFTGYFAGLRTFDKFYSGGIRRANFLAEEKNAENIKRFNKLNADLLIRVFNARLINPE